MAKRFFEITFGTRIQNAQHLITLLQSFTNYNFIRPEDSIVEMNKLIKLIQQTNHEEANLSQTYTLAVNARVKAFGNKDKGLKDLVTQTMASLRAQYGKTSKEVTSLLDLANKTRGVAKRITKETTNNKQISSSQQSYASVTQNFADFIASLAALTPPYKAINPNLSLEALNKSLDIARQNSQAVSLANAQLNKVRETRNNLYQDLKERVQRIKETVKAIYGTKSIEYESVKGLKV